MLARRVCSERKCSLIYFYSAAGRWIEIFLFLIYADIRARRYNNFRSCTFCKKKFLPS
jgi:hypothetical protein